MSEEVSLVMLYKDLLEHLIRKAKNKNHNKKNKKFKKQLNRNNNLKNRRKKTKIKRVNNLKNNKLRSKINKTTKSSSINSKLINQRKINALNVKRK